MDELTEVLTKATAAIECGYFHFNIAGGPSIYRERVYCYELYHKMRGLWPANSFYLNGEVDKAGHPLLPTLRRKKPDLLVHRPGDENGNHAVIEVKPSRVQDGDIRKDIETLALFRSEANYERAIYLIYGDGANDGLLERVRRIAGNFPGMRSIELWLHPVCERPAFHRGDLV